MTRDVREPLAVIGLACRFPGPVESPSQFWDLLAAGREAIGPLPRDRWDLGAWTHPDPARAGRSYAQRGGFLAGIDRFDAAFFGISPREACRMDPQQRLLLELTWEALEDAGQSATALAGSDTAVYVGMSAADYQHLQFLVPETADAYSNPGSANSIAANRLSYIFDFHGPSMAVDTACSSSLVALHLACDTVWSGRSPLAIAAGVNILLSPFPWIGFSKASMLSPTGRCHAFDAAADGYVRSEGGGVIVVKPFAEAVRDGDPIRALILASGTNADGRTPGMLLPSATAQSHLLRHVYERARIDPRDVCYVEAHGTGTAAGDPIECEGISRALAQTPGRRERLLVGSVKTNIGHLEAASGIAGSMKVILALQQRALPPTLHIETPNPALHLDEARLDLVTELTCLHEHAGPLVMGVNSFGFGGANAHVVFQDYRAPVSDRAHDARTGTPVSASAGASAGIGANISINGNQNGSDAARTRAALPRPLLISARDEDALRAQVVAHAQRLAGSEGDPAAGTLDDIRYTAAMRRAHHPHRLAAFGATATETASRLLAFVERGEAEQVSAGKVQAHGTKTAFVFSGNGSQWDGMGRELLRVAPPFRDAVARVDALFRPLAGWSLIELLEGTGSAAATHAATTSTADAATPGHVTSIPADAAAAAHSRDAAARADVMARTEIAQPALFALQVGLVELLAAYGITPDAVMGHSVGEVAAAYVAGILTLDQAVRVIHERSRAQARTAGSGGMAACGLSEEEAREAVSRAGGRFELASINSPRATTLSGDRAALAALGEELTPQGKFFRLLDLDYAFHSQAMDGIQQDLEHALAGLAPGVASMPFYSTTTGRVEAGPALDARYWWNNVRHPVLFGHAVTAALDDACATFVEIGPHAVLDPYVRQCLDATGHAGQSITTLKRHEPEWTRLLNAVGRCHVVADNVDLAVQFPASEGGRCVPLPAYPWQRKRHWNGGSFGRPALERETFTHPLLGYRTVAAEPVWEQVIDTGLLPALLDHRVLGSVVLPAAAIVEMALKAAALHRGTTACDLQGLDIRRPLVLPAGQTARIQFTISPDDGQFSLRSSTVGAGTDGPGSEETAAQGAGPDATDINWMLHAIGTIATATTGVRPERVSIAGLRARLGERLSASAFYERCTSKGLQYGPAFQRVREVWCGADEALAALDAVPRADEIDFVFPPAVLDACLQVALAAPESAGARDTSLYLPAQLKSFRLYAPAATAAWCHAEIQRRGSRSIVVRLTIYDAAGDVVAIADGLRARRLETSLESGVPLLDMRAEPQPHPRADRLDQTEHAAESANAPRTWIFLHARDVDRDGHGPGAGIARDGQGNGSDNGNGDAHAHDTRETLATAIVGRLTTDGHRVISVRPGAQYVRLAADRFVVPIQDAESLARLLGDLRADGSRIDEIIHGLGLAPQHGPRAQDDTIRDREQLRAAIGDGCLSVLALAQALARTGTNVNAGAGANGSGHAGGNATEALPRIWFLTQDANAIPASDRAAAAARDASPIGGAAASADGSAHAGAEAGDIDPSRAPVWGMRRVLAQEMPDLECRAIDLHDRSAAASTSPGAETSNGADSPLLLDRLMLELTDPDTEDEVLLTATERYVHRLVHHSLAGQMAADTVPAGDSAYKLSLPRPGSPDNLLIERCARPAPGPDQIEIRVRGTGLNFHDVMWTMGLLQDEAVETGFAGPTLGMECSGEVVRVGANVTHVRPGDAVIAFAPQCFSAYVMADAGDVFQAPAGMSWQDAATLLIAHCTSVYALESLARLQPGERVLIHGAAGGVGLAAIQYAQHVGAIVFATAGTDAKRDYLRQLGVTHIFNSRTADFAEQILAATEGEGVDVALNSLAGDAIARTMSVLRPFGRFLELGKRDFFEASRMSLAPFRNNLSYFGIDLDQALAVRRDFRQTVIPRVLALIREGALRPLPVRLFPVSQSRDAFRYMQKAEHIGKIVVSFEDADLRLPRQRAPFVARPDGAYVIAGGVSGLGLATARWLADKGARHLVLLHRSGHVSPDSRATLDLLRDRGVDIAIERVDIADERALDLVLDSMKDRMPAVRGVIQAAMVLDDVPVERMTAERFWRAASPKVLGTWNLHRLTLDAPLDFFVMYSSATTCLGNPGQANYAAGNAFMEALAHHRRARGLPATAVSWGAISDTGWLARNAQILKILERRIALRPMTAAQALECLEPLLSLDRANPIVADLDWAALAGPGHALVRAPRFARLVEGVRSGSDVPGVDLQAMLVTMPAVEARALIEQTLGQDLASILSSDATLDAQRPLAELGLDSLMAVELMTVIERRYRVQFGAMEIMGTTTLAQVADRILAKVQAGAGAGAAPATSAIPIEQEIDSLSDDAVDALLANLMVERNSTEITE
jgi:acyl transferase domain-containing protein/NADPH:quinone reductase-like Zn-dependent oxidoreductase/acyl carrier protein/short-subunit dehydrogenase